MTKHTHHLFQDFGIIVLSVIVAIILARTDALVSLLTSTKEWEIIGSFIAGMFFTSVFTTAPAIATLGEIAQVNSLALTVIFGGLGALVGDLLIFKFVKDRFATDLMELLGHQGSIKRIKAVFRLRFFRWLTWLLGGLIIASPLPDELGIGLLGFSKMKLAAFIPLSLIFNSLGILVIGLVARSLE